MICSVGMSMIDLYCNHINNCSTCLTSLTSSLHRAESTQATTIFYTHIRTFSSAEVRDFPHFLVYTQQHLLRLLLLLGCVRPCPSHYTVTDSPVRMRNTQQLRFDTCHPLSTTSDSIRTTLLPSACIPKRLRRCIAPTFPHLSYLCLAIQYETVLNTFSRHLSAYRMKCYAYMGVHFRFVLFVFPSLQSFTCGTAECTQKNL